MDPAGRFGNSKAAPGAGAACRENATIRVPLRTHPLTPLLIPRLHVTADRINGCTPWLSQALLLFAFRRCVAVNRSLRHVIVESRHWWVGRRSRVVGFDRIGRIVYRAQRMPGFGVRLADDGDDGASVAAFFIALELKETREEIRLFTVWERLPEEPSFLDRLAGTGDDAARRGDEESRRIVTLLRDYLGVPIGR